MLRMVKETGYTVDVGEISVFLNPRGEHNDKDYVLIRVGDGVSVGLARGAVAAVQDSFPRGFGETITISSSEGDGASSLIRGEMTLNESVAQSVLASLKSLLGTEEGEWWPR